MKNLYRCIICSTHTTALHEVIFGRGYREISLEAAIQVPLCQHCHESAHGRRSDSFMAYPSFEAWEFSRNSQDEIKKILAFKLCFNLEKMVYLYNQLSGIMGKQARDKIMAGKSEREKIIKKHEV